MVDLIRDLDSGRIRANLDRVRERAGDGVEILAATKYVPLDEMGALADAGVTLVGENRLQDLEAKRERWGDRFEWDFIGQLQSRRVRLIVPHVRLIHSLASESALRELERHAHLARPGLRVLLEVNVAGEADPENGPDQKLPDAAGWARTKADADKLKVVADWMLDPKNGKTAEPNWSKSAQAMSALSAAASKAAAAHDAKALAKASNDLSDACTSCHSVYKKQSGD